MEAGPGWDAAGTLALVLKARALDPSGKAILGADRLEGRARLALGEPARALALLEPLVTGGPMSPPAELLADVGARPERVDLSQPLTGNRDVSQRPPRFTDS